MPCGAREARSAVAGRAAAALKMRAHLLGLVLLKRAGVRLAFTQAEFRQYVKNLPALDFHLACEIVDSNLAHPPLFRYLLPKALSAHSYLMALAAALELSITLELELCALIERVARCAHSSRRAISSASSSLLVSSAAMFSTPARRREALGSASLRARALLSAGSRSSSSASARTLAASSELPTRFRLLPRRQPRRLRRLDFALAVVGCRYRPRPIRQPSLRSSSGAPSSPSSKWPK